MNQVEKLETTRKQLQDIELKIEKLNLTKQMLELSIISSEKKIQTKIQSSEEVSK